MDATRFGTGLTYQAFKDSMTQNRERLEAAEAAVVLDPRDLEYFRSLRPLSCAALVEDWCGDVVANLPVVAALAREVAPTLDLRCFIKADVPDLATRYLNKGRFESLPVFAFFDADWDEVGVLIERPVAVTERREEDRRAVYASDPEFGSARCAGKRAARRRPHAPPGRDPGQADREHPVGEPPGGGGHP